jgi:hypothetical protein
MEIRETIVLILFLGILVIIAFGMLWKAIVWPICNYYTTKPSNLVQWEAVETAESYYERQKGGKRLFDLYYRVLPSDLNLFVRIFATNEWKLRYENVELENKEEFIEYISEYKTLNDIKNNQGRIHWLHP